MPVRLIVAGTVTSAFSGSLLSTWMSARNWLPHRPVPSKVTSTFMLAPAARLPLVGLMVSHCGREAKRTARLSCAYAVLKAVVRPSVPVSFWMPTVALLSVPVIVR